MTLRAGGPTRLQWPCTIVQRLLFLGLINSLRKGYDFTREERTNSERRCRYTHRHQLARSFVLAGQLLCMFQSANGTHGRTRTPLPPLYSTRDSPQAPSVDADTAAVADVACFAWISALSSRRSRALTGSRRRRRRRSCALALALVVAAPLAASRRGRLVV